MRLQVEEEVMSDNFKDDDRLEAHLKTLPQFDSGAFVNCLAQTLSAANCYLVSQLSSAGLKNLVPSHGDILLELFQQENITMQHLSERIHRDPSTVTTLVKKLVDAGYVQTRKSCTDKRRTEVSLTVRGKGLKGDFDSISKRLVEVQMDGIDAEQFDITCRTLADIRKNFLNACKMQSKERESR